MDFSVPSNFLEERKRFKAFLDKELVPNLSNWYQQGRVPREFHLALGEGRWFGFEMKNGSLTKQPALRNAIIGEEMAILSPGVAVAALAQSELGLMGLWLFGSKKLKQKYGPLAVAGETLMCLGNSESGAGTDVANIAMQAKKVAGGWLLNGVKAYVTNGLISDLAVITAVSDPHASRNRKISMFLVDLGVEGVTRKKLNKQVWVPSDLTRITLSNAFVPEDHLLGLQGQGLQQVLTVFTYSRVAISALTLATAMGAYEMAIMHAKKREVLGHKIADFQAKAFEIADFYARIEAARLMLWKACAMMDEGDDFRLESSLAKYLAVGVAREVTSWAADVFGAASVMLEHPIHKFPMDAWASSLGEGTQDVQKLVIFREIMKKHGSFHAA